MLKGTGKAIDKVLKLALWFQQREEYAVVLKTGSVAAIDDIEINEDENIGMESENMSENHNDDADALAVPRRTAEGDMEDVAPEQRQEDDGVEQSRPPRKRKRRKKVEMPVQSDGIPETRIRYISVLEAAVSLR